MHLLPLTLLAAVILGGAAALWLIPASDEARALSGITDASADVRRGAWAWLAAAPPGGRGPRLLTLLNDDPALLEVQAQRAGQAIRISMAVSLLNIDGFRPAMLSEGTLRALIQALQSGSEDDAKLSQILQATGHAPTTVAPMGSGSEPFAPGE
ncbi:MAG: hypothetical protein MK101_06350 [Phycisphaerales bacterium]|nr:hypothetical protein [Phycisphaerales bacterium]